MTNPMTSPMPAPTPGPTPDPTPGPIPGPGPDAVLRDRTVLARHGRSFRLAGRLLGPAASGRAAGLYAACRAIDDLADEHPDPDLARRTLRDLRADLASSETRTELGRRFQALRIDPHPAAVLVDTMLSDLEPPVRVADEAALLSYAYGAAGTVGLMMCDVLDVSDPIARRHAVSLGMAMQLTNIARDVREDAGRDRIYLPRTWLGADADPAELPHADPRRIFPAVRRTLLLAERHYADGIAGFRFLDRRSALAISVATALYRAIGHVILRRGPVPWSAPRPEVPTVVRSTLVLRCLAAWASGSGREARGGLFPGL